MLFHHQRLSTQEQDYYIACRVLLGLIMVSFLRARFGSIRILLTIMICVSFLGSILEPVDRIESLVETSYTSLGTPLELGKIPALCEAFQRKNIEVRLIFKVKASSIEGRYTNIFQSDDLNSGFRIEIDQEGDPGLVINTSETSNSEFTVLMPRGVVLENQETEIEVMIFYGSKIQMTIGKEEPKVVEGIFRPSCNRVQIGGGYDSTRSTIGIVQARIFIAATRVTANFGIPLSARKASRSLFTILLVALYLSNRKKRVVQ
jgi:hypothetical protein